MQACFSKYDVAPRGLEKRVYVCIHDDRLRTIAALMSCLFGSVQIRGSAQIGYRCISRSLWELKVLWPHERSDVCLCAMMQPLKAVPCMIQSTPRGAPAMHSVGLQPWDDLIDSGPARWDACRLKKNPLSVQSYCLVHRQGSCSLRTGW